MKNIEEGMVFFLGVIRTEKEIVPVNCISMGTGFGIHLGGAK